MKIILFPFLGIMMLAGTGTNAQKITYGDEAMTFLAGESCFKIQYKYHGMVVGDVSETVYRTNKRNYLNEKTPGKGNEWEKSWIEARSKYYEPKFEELLNKYLAKKGVSVSKNDTSAKYRMVVRTLKTDPIYPERYYYPFYPLPFPLHHYSTYNPNVDFEVSWIEIATDSLMAKVEMINTSHFEGDYYIDNFKPSKSLVDSYAVAGKKIGKFMSNSIQAIKKGR